MKCPKCNEKFILDSCSSYGWCSQYNTNGGCGFDLRGVELKNEITKQKQELEKIKYQQRLDKVLEKFEYRKGINNTKGYYNYRHIAYSTLFDEEVSLFTIRYSNKEEGFYFVGGGVKQPISLDTVEHLIKDMEAQND